MEIVMAFCSNCWLHIWDLNEESLLQTIKIKFPFLGVLGKKVEFGAYCIHPGPALQKTVEDERSPTTSRGSSVVRACGGGLQLTGDDAQETSGERSDTEFSLSHRCLVLVSCCDCACAVPLGAPAAPRAPPGDCRSARLPHAWDPPETAAEPRAPATPRRVTPPRAPSPPRVPKPPPISEDLEKLLENAGLKNILEKDFVLMKGLKHDLNLKLAEMETNREAMLSAVAAGAPYLALRTYEAETLAPVDEMTDAYARAMRLFPPSSTAGTPTEGSASSTPRRSRTSRNSSKT